MLVLSIALAITSNAQKNEMEDQASSLCAKWYDLQNEETIEGIINKVKQISTTKDMTFGTHLIVDYEGRELEILLGPSWYLEKNKVQLTKHNIIEVSGCLSIFENQPAMIAKWLMIEGDTLYLRDEKGFPKWVDKGKNKKGGRNRNFKS